MYKALLAHKALRALLERRAYRERKAIPDHREHKVRLVLKDPKALRGMSALKV